VQLDCNWTLLRLARVLLEPLFGDDDPDRLTTTILAG